jgi:hypothetical protein
MADAFRRHGLSLVAAGLFLLTLLGQTVAGLAHHNEEQREHGEEPVSLGAYLVSGAYGEAVFENWESEFLQMGVFIVLTATLVQKGSAESRKPSDEAGDRPEPTEEPPERHRGDPGAPWPVRRGGLALSLYKRSLGIVLFLLFLLSFAGHAVAGAVNYNEEARHHGGEVVSTLGYLSTSQFWFESFQNWQSEFLSVLALALLSIWFRQQGSPESKPVHAPHEQTGAE